MAPTRPPQSDREVRVPRGTLLLIFALALAMRAAIGFWADGRGEMEGLAWRYRADAMAMVVGYGFERAAEDRPKQVDLLPLADSLASRGERLSPAKVPPKDPSRWKPSGLHPPGYAWFLSIVYRTFGEPLLFWAKAIQAIVDSLTALVVVALGRRFVSRRAGVFAGFAYALFPPLAYLVTSHVADAFMPIAYAGSFALFVRGLETRRYAWYAASGAVVGLASLLRPDSLLLPTFFLLGALAQPRARWHAALGVAVLVAAAALVLVPWGLHNRRAHGHFQLTTSAGGMSLFQSIGQFPNPYGIVFDDDVSADSARAAGFEGLDDPAANRYFTQRFLTIARENPGLIAGNMFRRIPLGIVPLYHWGFDNRAYAASSFYAFANRDHLDPYQAAVRHPRRVFAAYWDRLIFGVVALLLFVAGVALFVAERRRWYVVLLLWLPYAYLVLSHVPLMLGARLLVPGVFGQLVMLGYWYDRLVRREDVHVQEIVTP